VAERLELAADVRVVVDFAVEAHPDGAVLVRQRLLPGAQIDDAEAAMRQRRVRVAVQPGFVRAAVSDDVAHPRRARRRIRVEPVNCDNACNSAHGQGAFGEGREMSAVSWAL